MAKTPAELSDNLTFLINRTAKEQTAWFDSQMRSLDLDRGQWRVLGYLAFFDDINQTQLARLLGMGKAPLGQLIARLEEAGWIIREPSPSDKRSYTLRAAEAFSPLAELVRKLMELESERLMLGLSRREREQLRRTLEKIDRNVRSTPETEEIRALREKVLAELRTLGTILQ